MKASFRINIEDDNTFSGNNTRKNVLFNGVSNIKQLKEKVYKVKNNDNNDQNVYKVNTAKINNTNESEVNEKIIALNPPSDTILEKKKVGVFKKSVTNKDSKELDLNEKINTRLSINKTNYDTKFKKSIKRPFNNRKSYQEIFESDSKNQSTSGDKHNTSTSKRYYKMNNSKKKVSIELQDVSKIKKSYAKNSIDTNSSIKEKEKNKKKISKERGTNKNSIDKSSKEEDFWNDDSKECSKVNE
jgi:hypothetical protein